MTNDFNGSRIIDDILDDGSWMRICGCFSRRHLSLNTFSLIRRILRVITNGRPAVAGHAWAACSWHACKERAGSGQQTGRVVFFLLFFLFVLLAHFCQLEGFFSFTNSFSCARVCFCDQDCSKLVAADHQKSYWQQQLRGILILSCEQSLIT